MKNILIVDEAVNATFSVFQATDTEFTTLFPNGEEIEVIEDVIDRAGDAVADEILARVWERPILKSEAQGIHAILIHGEPSRRDYPFATKQRHAAKCGTNMAGRRSNCEYESVELIVKS